MHENLLKPLSRGSFRRLRGHRRIQQRQRQQFLCKVRQGQRWQCTTWPWTRIAYVRCALESKVEILVPLLIVATDIDIEEPQQTSIRARVVFLQKVPIECSMDWISFPTQVLQFRHFQIRVRDRSTVFGSRRVVCM